MYNLLFKQLGLSELQRYSDELKLGIENHARWIAQVNRTLICKLPPNPNDTCDHPDHQCKFGRWYHGIKDPAITSLDSFTAIDDVHQQVHQLAKQLLVAVQNNEECRAEVYDNLLVRAEELRSKIDRLLHELTHSCTITSRLMTKVFENAAEGVLIAAPDTTIISVNKAFTEVTGYTFEEAVGNTPRMLQSGHHDKAFYRQMWQEINEFGKWQGEIWNRNKQGEEYLEWLSISAVHDEQEELSHFVGIFTDITQAKENEERLQYLAHYDQLTGLPNRVLFDDRLRQAIAQARREQRQVAVLFLDLDGFKAVNDTLGHTSGDEMLQQVSERLTHCLRATDSVARFGGDEFTIALAAIEDRDDVIRIANKIIAEVARPYYLDGTEASVTTSIGISFYPGDGSDPNVLIQRADTAMYHAKRHGKNHHEFFGEI